MEEGKKECIGCYELINEKASRCPHCSQIQSSILTFQHNKYVLAFLMILMIALMVFMANLFSKLGKHNSEVKLLTIVSEDLYTRTVNGVDHISCSWMVKNSSSLRATYIDFRADFFNKNDELIDTIANNNNLTIDMYSEVPYRVRGQADKPLGEYAYCKVAIMD